VQKFRFEHLSSILNGWLMVFKQFLVVHTLPDAEVCANLSYEI